MINIFSKSLDSAIEKTKKIRVSGVVFRIKKIDSTNYLEGSKAVVNIYEIYKTGNSTTGEETKNWEKKLRSHYRDVFLASVVSPKLARKEEEEGFFVDKIFMDWELANGLYEKIMHYTYGKKKRDQ